jgi:peptide subunit release factor RF-3
MSNFVEEISRRRMFAIISHPDAGKRKSFNDKNKSICS